MLAKINTALIAVLGSPKFLWAVIILAAVQALWYALAIAPEQFDELRHIGVIYAYMEIGTPFFAMQDPQWDFLGDITRDGSYAFYYALALVGYVVTAFTESETALIITLRVVMVALFVLGLWFYARALKLLPVKPWLVHVALLLVIMLPTIAPLPGVINYDNAVFALFGIALYYALKLCMHARRIDVHALFMFVLIGCIGSIVKTQFVALYAPLFIYVLYMLWAAHGRELPRKLWQRLRAYSVWRQVAMFACMAVAIAAFIERPLYNTVVYQKIAPQSACEQVLGSEERCMQNPIAARNAILRAQNDEPPLNPLDYAYGSWAPWMSNTLLLIVGHHQGGVKPVPMLFFWPAFTLAAVFIIMNMRRLWQHRGWRMLLIGSLSYVALLYVSHYLLYVEYGQVVGVNGRYLLAVLPILTLLALVSVRDVLGPRLKRVVLPLATACMAIVLVQGGGIGTAMSVFEEYRYWDQDVVRTVNNPLREGMQTWLWHDGPWRHR